MIAEETVRRIAELAHLEVADSNIKQLAKELSHIIDYVEQLKELKLDNVKPTSHAVEVHNVFRSEGDVVHADVVGKEVLSQAPEGNGVFFRVPKVL